METDKVMSVIPPVNYSHSSNCMKSIIMKAVVQMFYKNIPEWLKSMQWLHDGDDGTTILKKIKSEVRTAGSFATWIIM
jgi:hypothetical protein